MSININLAAIHASAAHAAINGLKGRELFRAAFENICTNGDKDDFKAARIAWTNHAYETMRSKVGDKADAEYARTLFYRELANSGLKAPGKNAGKRPTADATVDYSEQALVAAYRAADWNLCRRIIAAAEKAVQDAKANVAAAEPTVK